MPLPAVLPAAIRHLHGARRGEPRPAPNARSLHHGQHPLFASMTDIGQVEFTVIPDDIMAILRSGHLVRNFYMLYGMLDHCSIYLAQAARSHLFMIPVDSIVADGSLDNMANARRYGFECCGGGNIVAENETFLPALDARFGPDGPISRSPRDLATLSPPPPPPSSPSQLP